MEHNFVAQRSANVPVIVCDNEDVIEPTFIPGDESVAEKVRYEYGDSWLEINPEFAGAAEWFYTDNYDTDDTSYDFEEIIEAWMDYTVEYEGTYDFDFDRPIGNSNRRSRLTSRKAPAKKQVRSNQKKPTSRKAPAKKSPVKKKTTQRR